MRRSITLLASALLLVVLTVAASLAIADDGGIRTVSGRVVSVDMKAATVVVRPEASSLQPANVTLSFDGDTKIRKAGLKITLADIHPGDAITANFKTDGARSLALALLVE